MTANRFAKGTLTENSEIYFQKADLYERFAACEDFDGLALAALKSRVAGLDVLDVGCGTGKYVVALSPVARWVTGVDAAASQLDRAVKAAASLGNVSFTLGDAAEVDLGLGAHGAAIACWMLGTVLDEAKRKRVVDRVCSSLRPGSVFWALENDASGEFEEVRGRVEACRAHHDWLSRMGFEVDARIKGRFRFESQSEASEVFGAIWGEAVARKVSSQEVEHDMILWQRRV